MWRSDEIEIAEISIRGKEYDAKMFGICAVAPPRPDTPYWEIEFVDGTKMVTDDVVTVRFGKKKNL